MIEDCTGPALPAPFSVAGFSCLSSTSDEAKSRAKAGAPHGSVIWAKEQTKGRGRFDRVWSSPPGNLYMSVVLRPRISIAHATELGFVAAVAVADCIASFLPITKPVHLKWPNDVLVAGAKVAGMLLEVDSGTDGQIVWTVIGIGINIQSHPDVTIYPATAIHHQTPLRPSVEDVLAQLCGSLGDTIDQWQTEGFDAIRTRWLARAQGIGQPIELRQGNNILFGRFRDLASDGALLLDTPTGLHRISAGDVHFPAA